VRCPRCGSLDTKRKGWTTTAPTALRGQLEPLQRFLCRTCRRSFTSPRKTARPRASFADDVVLEAVRLYVQALTSYRVLAALLERRLGRSISRFTLNTWVDEIGGRAKTTLEVSQELRPQWGGFLGVDGKAIFVGREQRCLLIGVDHPTQDVVHALVLPDENPDGFIQLITEARLDAGYPLRGVISDLATGFLEAHQDHFGEIPFQACRVHFDRRLDDDIPKRKRSPDAHLRAELKGRIRAVLYASTYSGACDGLGSLVRDRERYAHILRTRVDSLRSLERRFAAYTAYHFTPGLPPDNNVAENVIKQLNKKLRLMEGFASLESAERFCRLLVGCYRFKRFTDSRNGSNGKAPLEAAGVDLVGRDWLTFLINS
jgi:transposase-like protein